MGGLFYSNRPHFNVRRLFAGKEIFGAGFMRSSRIEVALRLNQARER